jgi:ssDNA-binding Zn-finger/Zn-ribbon topoisomerase 1
MEKAQNPLTCPECGAPMELRTSTKFLRKNQTVRKFFGCSNFPKCRATHGAHQDGRPLGIPGDQATKDARVRAHNIFDKLWKGTTFKRGRAYRWLEFELKLQPGTAHIGSFDIAMCEKVIEACKRRIDENKVRHTNR